MTKFTKVTLDKKDWEEDERRVGVFLRVTCLVTSVLGVAGWVMYFLK